MIKLVVYDLDGTIAAHEGVAYKGVIEHLHKLDEKNVKIMFCSAKPSAYISGFVRQIGLSNALIGGEHGSDTYLNCHFPPKGRIEYTLKPEESKQINEAKAFIINKYQGDIWIQPNNKTFCFFIINKEKTEEIYADVDRFVLENKDLQTIKYREPACEILPKGISKESGLKSVLKYFNLKPDEVIAVGDGENDIPMLHVASHSVGIGREEAEYYARTPQEAYQLVEDIIEMSEFL